MAKPHAPHGMTVRPCSVYRFIFPPNVTQETEDFDLNDVIGLEHFPKIDPLMKLEWKAGPAMQMAECARERRSNCFCPIGDAFRSLKCLEF